MIVLEGINGVGKTTLAKKLVKDLCKYTHFPFEYRKIPRSMTKTHLYLNAAYSRELMRRKHIIQDRTPVVSEAIYGQMPSTTLDKEKGATWAVSQAVGWFFDEPTVKPLIIAMETTPKRAAIRHKRDFGFSGWEYCLIHFMYFEFFRQLIDRGYPNIIFVNDETNYSDIIYMVLEFLHSNQGLCL